MFDKTLDLTAVRLFNVKSEVFHLDNINQLKRRLLYRKCQPVFDNPVSVINDSKQIIGAAMLELVGTVLTADIYLDYSTPERFDIETKARVLWAKPEGWAEMVYGQHVSRYFIKSLIISNYCPDDDRIQCL